MRRHWQKKPLLVRQAWPGVQPPIARSALFDLASADGVESRLLSRFDGHWRLRHGPLARRALPPLKRADWTLLVQGLDLHCQPAHDMLQRFRFVPEARLDDLMISYASDGGGVGPHLDSYDVFLLQVQGKRRWRIGQWPTAVGCQACRCASWPTSSPPRTGCSNPATCSTCRRCGAMTAALKVSA